jgi:hypothetical protein
VHSLECWMNPNCDSTKDHCYKQTYEEGSCFPKAGSNFSVKYNCNSDTVFV